ASRFAVEAHRRHEHVVPGDLLWPGLLVPLDPIVPMLGRWVLLHTLAGRRGLDGEFTDGHAMSFLLAAPHPPNEHPPARVAVPVAPCDSRCAWNMPRDRRW